MKKLRSVVGFVALMLSGCVALGDTAFKAAGELVDTSGEPYQECRIQVVQGDEVVYNEGIPGIFETTVIFAPVPFKPLYIHLSCSGASEDYVYRLERIPTPFGEVMDFGRVILD